MTDYSWEVQERAEQKELFESHRRDRELYSSEEERNKRFESKQKKVKRKFLFGKKRDKFIEQNPTI